MRTHPVDKLLEQHCYKPAAVFTCVTNRNVLGKLPIRDSNNREIAIGGFGKNTIHT